MRSSPFASSISESVRSLVFGFLFRFFGSLNRAALTCCASVFVMDDTGLSLTSSERRASASRFSPSVFATSALVRCSSSKYRATTSEYGCTSTSACALSLLAGVLRAGTVSSSFKASLSNSAVWPRARVMHCRDHWAGEDGLSSYGEEARTVLCLARCPRAQRQLEVASSASRVTLRRKGEPEVEDAVPGAAQIGCEAHDVSHLCGPPAVFAA